MHIVDILYSIPMLLYVILLMVVFKPGLLNIYLALGIATGSIWPASSAVRSSV